MRSLLSECFPSLPTSLLPILGDHQAMQNLKKKNKNKGTGGGRDWNVIAVVKLLCREWWRPVAPMVTLEDAKRLFAGPSVRSPYMSFAPKIREKFRDELPAVVHFDGTARLQTVEQSQNDWLWRLLEAVKKITGKAMLCNTSFNTKGRPIVNRMREAMRMLYELPDLDYILVGDVLFNKNGAEKTRRLWGAETRAVRYAGLQWPQVTKFWAYAED